MQQAGVALGALYVAVELRSMLVPEKTCLELEIGLKAMPELLVLLL